MKISILIFLLYPFLLTSLMGQTSSDERTFFSEDFNWTISVPEGFHSVSPAEWAILQNKGKEAVEDTFGEEVINYSKTIFVVKNGNLNYLESSFQPYNAEINGNFLESCQGIMDIYYKTIETQIPNGKIDSTSYVQLVSGLEFQTFHFNIDINNELKMHSFMFSRLFGDKRFSLSITYINEEQGKKMIETWINSKFE